MMTVEDLMRELETLPRDAQVATDGIGGLRYAGAVRLVPVRRCGRDLVPVPRPEDPPPSDVVVLLRPD